MSAARQPGADAEVTFRRATESDVLGIVELYASLSNESCRMRFFGAMPRASLEAAAAIGGEREAVAVVAVAEGRVLGEARYLMHGDGDYELGIAVADDSQCHGIGRRLLQMLRRQAAADGIQTLHAVVRVDNFAMLRTLRSLGTAIVEPVDDTVIAEISCVGGMPGWPRATAGRRVLVELNSLWENPATAALREGGFEVRQCLGPKCCAQQTCPLVLSGDCPLAEGADIIACLLPEGDPSCREVAEDHAAHRPDRLAARSHAEWQAAVSRLVGSRTR